MQLVAKATLVAAGSGEDIPDDERRALIRWYVGRGSAADELTGVHLVQRARANNRWLACDCLASGDPPPLLGPAYLELAQTYYLRRLTGKLRPEHRAECPFYRDQVLTSGVKPEGEVRAEPRADRFFYALKPLGERLAQQSTAVADDRVSPRTAPRLARLLWRLLQHAGCNDVPAIGMRPRPSIALEFERLRSAAADFLIAPGISLQSHFYTHADDVRRASSGGSPARGGVRLA